jgi:Skp family chaperone for outer membrane proteins
MRMKLLPVLMLTSLLLAGCTGKTAVINPDLIFQESDAGKSGVAYLSDLSRKLQEELADSNLQPEKGGKGNAQAALQQRISEAQQRYGAEQARVMEQINALFLKALETCRARGRFSVVLVVDAAPAYDPAADLTQKVMEEMNATPLIFSPPSPQGGENSPPSAE